MLDRGAHTLALHALDVTDGDARSEEGVFAEILKVSPVHWGTIDVDSRRKEEMNAFGARVTSEFNPDTFGQFRIPRRGQANATGKRSGGSKVTDADGSVGHF